jgi:hypothetical protein
MGAEGSVNSQLERLASSRSPQEFVICRFKVHN